MDSAYYCTSKKTLTQLAKSMGLVTWQQLTNLVKKLPYGRNKNRTDVSLVLTEMKGTCSSKHALLKAIADENCFTDVKLHLGIFKMNKTNTPKIGKLLNEKQLPYIPEAHCYISMTGKRIDFTNEQSDIDKIANDIIREIEILPQQVATYKTEYHREFLKQWLVEMKINYTLEQLWEIRESCINILLGKLK